MSNQNRESRYVRVARMAYALAQKTMPRYSHPKSPHHFTLPQLTACVLLMFYLDLSYRDMEEWLLATDAVCRVLELKRVPDHSTLYRAYQRLRMADLDRMQRELLAALDVQEETVAVDATGYRPTQASAYFQTRRGRPWRTYRKAGYAVGTQSQLILACRQRRGPGSDAPLLAGLRRDAGRYGRHAGRWRAWLLLADAGFDAHSIHALDLIPPMRRHGKLVAPERKARADLVAVARLDGVYGQRWKSETVHSVLKRKFGDAIRSRQRWHQHREPAVKGLVYNLHR